MIIKRYLYLLVLLTALLSLASSCHLFKKEGNQTVYLNLGTDPITLDPQQTSDQSSLLVVRQISEGLTRVNPLSKIELGLAKVVEPIGEGERYRVVLRSIKWSDGTPLTIYDFIRAWSRVLRRKISSSMAQQMFVIKNAKRVYEGSLPIERLGIEIISDLECVIHLEKPTDHFMYLLSTPLFYPVPSWESDPDEAIKISVGPYRLTHWSPEEHIVIEKNPNYWASKEWDPPSGQREIKRIIFLLEPDEHKQVRLYQRGGLDWCGDPLLPIPSKQLKVLDDTGRLSHYECASTRMLVFNTRRHFLSNKKIRRALSLAINRPSMVRYRVLPGSPAARFTPSFISGRDDIFFPYYDPGQAKALFHEGLKELGLDPLELSKVTFITPKVTKNHNHVKAIKEQWRYVLGFDVNVEQMPWRKYKSRLKSGEFDIATTSWVADIPNSKNFLETYYSAKSICNYSGWDDSRYRVLLDEASYAQNSHRRKRYYFQAEQYLMSQMPVAPLCFPVGSYMKSSRLKGVYCHPMGYLDFRWAYLGVRD